MRRNCESAAKNETVKIGNVNSLTGSNQSSHSPSAACEHLDVKVEITPAPPTSMSDTHNSYSIESNSSMTLCTDASIKSQAASPNARKFSEISHEGGGSFLNPISNFNRLNPSPPNSASGRLFKKLEEMIDLSSPYNHYRCLSPSETNLSVSLNERSHNVSPCAPRQPDTLAKPGSSRLLRRQYSLDKDDLTMQGNQSQQNQNPVKHVNLETISSMVEATKHQNSTMKAQYQPLISSSSLPASGNSLISTKLHKHQSASVAQDLEKIEEIPIPISPINNNNSSLNQNNSTNDLNSFKNSTSNNNLKTPPPTNKENNNEFNLNIEAVSLR